MNQVGDELRTARESRKLSLQQVEADLGVPLHYLEAIEGRKSNLIADEFYLVPFLRRYAEFLDLDAPGLIARFLAESVRNETAASQSLAPMARRSRRWVWIVIALLLASAAAAWWLLPAAGTRP